MRSVTGLEPVTLGEHCDTINSSDIKSPCFIYHLNGHITLLVSTDADVCIQYIFKGGQRTCMAARYTDVAFLCLTRCDIKHFV